MRQSWEWKDGRAEREKEPGSGTPLGLVTSWLFFGFFFFFGERVTPLCAYANIILGFLLYILNSNSCIIYTEFNLLTCLSPQQIMGYLKVPVLLLFLFCWLALRLAFVMYNECWWITETHSTKHNGLLIIPV